MGKVKPYRENGAGNVWVTGVKMILTEIARKPSTLVQLAEKTGLNRNTVSLWLDTLHSRPNLVYVERWQRPSGRGPWVPVFGFGHMQDDADKPKPMTLRQRKLVEAIRLERRALNSQAVAR